jgi:hypothetical protein
MVALEYGVADRAIRRFQACVASLAGQLSAQLDHLSTLSHPQPRISFVPTVKPVRDSALVVDAFDLVLVLLDGEHHA